MEPIKDAQIASRQCRLCKRTFRKRFSEMFQLGLVVAIVVDAFTVENVFARLSIIRFRSWVCECRPRKRLYSGSRRRRA